MKIPGLILLMGLANLAVCDDDERHALFVHTGSLDPLDPVSQYSDELDDAEIQRSSNRQEASPSQPARQYLPVPEQSIKERPRPFQPQPTLPPATFAPETPSATYIPAQPSQPPSSYPTHSSSPYPLPPTSPHPGYPQPQPPHPPFPSVRPGTELPPSTLLPPGDGPYTRPNSPNPPFNPQSTYPSSPQTYPTGPTGPETYPGTYPSSTPGTYPSSTPGTYPSSTPGTYPSSTPGTYYTSTSTGIPGDISESGDEQVVIGTGSNEVDGQHPPHIHEINVQCAKDMMTINLEFNRPFDGVIYSKGFYKDESCRYVNSNSGQMHFSFTVRLNSCGTQFIDQFKEGGQAYLENVLVIQNEPGIQEVSDTSQFQLKI
ncbi:hypothetical protein C0J52_16198 [Blattella germanica]|nr:hypothetical protein C0J52_16198 [Blattella germanica]